jgi:hypothetical protein
MIARTRLPIRQKIALCSVFGLGVLVVLLAILNRVYNFVMRTFGFYFVVGSRDTVCSYKMS